MPTWVKIFSDNSCEYGKDSDIAIGKASWSKGKLENICAVEFRERDERRCLLVVPNTSWHQFDRFSVIVSEGTHQPTRTHRVIQAKIKEEHIGFFLTKGPSNRPYPRWAVSKVQHPFDSLCMRITKEHVGKWLTVILPSRGRSEITFSVRGKMHDNKHIPR
jgi:hypothetical protein